MCFYFFLRVNGRQQPRTLQIDSRFKVILEVLQEFLTLALHVTASPHQPCRVLMRLCTLLHRKCSGREAWQMPLFLGRLRPSLHESPPLPDSPDSVLSAQPGSVTRRPRSHKRLSVSGALKALVKVLRERSQQWHS